MSSRRSWDPYFMGIAEQVSSRSTCDRKHVGAVVVKDRTIIATGYNGSMAMASHCDDEDVGHMMINGHCERTVHAEANAIAQAAKNGVSVAGAKMYCNTFPCWNCFKLIVNAGIAALYYKDAYNPDPRVMAHATQLGVHLVQIAETGDERNL